jgi:oligopeptide/dipeptide ABC transporter ATP-binding protein
VEFPIRSRATVRAVDRVSFELAAGTTLGVVGESGSGKSVLIRSIMRILDYPGRISAGSVVFRGEDLLAKSEREMRAIRGREIAMIFQNPAGSLSPVATITSQFLEAIRAHEHVSRSTALARARAALNAVGIEAPDSVLNKRPFEISSGLIQRIMIGLALVTGPALLLADEPTTSLDLIVQEQIMTTLRRVQSEFGTAIIFISHDMGVVSEISERIMVMYGGRTVEQGNLQEVLRTRRHPYTDGLIRSVPSSVVRPGMRLYAIPGQPPDLARLGKGCSFASRCGRVHEICRKEDPALSSITPERAAACHFPIEEKESVLN